MRISKPLLLLLLGGSLSYGSTLNVYKDSSFYTYKPETTYLGFAINIRAKCKTKVLPLMQTTACPEDKRLCKLHSALKFLEEKKQVTSANIKILGQLLTLPKPESIDGNALIQAAKLTAEEESTLLSLAKQLESDIAIQDNAFRKQAPSNIALHLHKACDDEVEITIPHGIQFSTHYEGNILDGKNIEVTQYLSVLNRSGIDIQADTAHFYYRSAHQYVYPVHFSPWIVSKYVPRPNARMMTKSMAKAAPAPTMEMAMVEDVMGTAVPQASYEDAREYKVKNLTLPSSGEVVDQKLLTYKTALKCEIQAYPYVNTRAFNVCSFKPKYQIDANQWKINDSSVLLNEKAVGEYRDDSYSLYTKIDEDIKIRRKPIVKRERESGIFGGTVRKKDGFNIVISNKSDKEKTLTLTDRIPTSTTEEINSKLLSVKSEKKIDYKVLKDGKIEMHLTLAANETKKIEVMFELSYDKDLKVNY